MRLRNIRKIEEAGLNAWPAHQMLFDGWLLRFANGYTKRANSVNPVYKSTLELGQKIEYCEQVYQEMALPPIFRLTPLAQTDLDLLLAERGYQKIDQTNVLTLSLEDWSSQEIQDLQMRELPLEQWMGVFSQINASPIEKQPAHTEILRNIINPCTTVAFEISGKWIACGLGVLEREWFGLFDIVTHPDHRRQGYGTRLISQMLTWAKTQGARRSYLQVMESNTPALALYAGMGYSAAYKYWYRVPQDFR